MLTSWLIQVPLRCCFHQMVRAKWCWKYNYVTLTMRHGRTQGKKSIHNYIRWTRSFDSKLIINMIWNRCSNSIWFTRIRKRIHKKFKYREIVFIGFCGGFNWNQTLVSINTNKINKHRLFLLFTPRMPLNFRYNDSNLFFSSEGVKSCVRCALPYIAVYRRISNDPVSFEIFCIQMKDKIMYYFVVRLISYDLDFGFEILNTQIANL